MDTPRPAEAHMRKVRSFVRRPGRATAAQRRAFAELLPRYGIGDAGERLDLARLFGRDAKRVLDIGFGDGEALVTNALNNPGGRLSRHRGARARHRPSCCCCSSRPATTNVRVIARDAADVVPAAHARRELRRRRSVLSGSVAEEAPSQAAARAAAVRRGDRARAQARRHLCTSRPIGPTTRGTRARCSRATHAARCRRRGRSLPQSARAAPADEVRAPRPAARARRRRSCSTGSHDGQRTHDLAGPPERAAMARRAHGLRERRCRCC